MSHFVLHFVLQECDSYVAQYVAICLNYVALYVALLHNKLQTNATFVTNESGIVRAVIYRSAHRGR
jgi:hypothetical protein